MTESRYWRGRLLAAAISSMATLVACGGDDLLLPRDGEPARITPIIDDALLADTVGQSLSDSLVVEVTDPGGRPVSGVEVSFTLPTGSAAEPGSTVLTGADGRAAVAYTLGPVAGQQTIQASAPIVPEENAVATFQVSALPDVPQILRMFHGDSQSAQVNTVLNDSLEVRAEDRFGNGVPGIQVNWEAEGGGEVNPTSVTTGADGRAATARTLGNRPGTYRSVAEAELEGSPVAFTATAVAAPRPELVLVTQPSATAVAGQPLVQQPVIQLQDPFGAPLDQEGVSVTVQIAGGDGSIGGRTSVSSDAAGRVVFPNLELQGEVGSRTLIFAADGFTPVTSTTILVQPGPPDPDQSSVSVPNGTAGSETTIAIRLRDEFGNNITDAAGDLTVNITGANTVEALSVTDQGNGSYSAAYVPVRTGTDAVTLRYRGATLEGPPAESVVAPGPADPSTTTAVVTTSGVIFVRVDVEVTTRDAQGNLLGRGGDQVQIIPNGGAPRTCQPNGETGCRDNEDGTYSDSFILFASAVRIDILLNGVPLAGSPYGP
jgi:hypothetical protein